MRTRWYRDPLVAFLVLGALLFVIVGDLDEDEQSCLLYTSDAADE